MPYAYQRVSAQHARRVLPPAMPAMYAPKRAAVAAVSYRKYDRRPYVAKRPAAKKARRKKSVAGSVGGGIMVLRSDCLKDYTASLLNPWSGPAACVPSWPCPPSLKVKAFVKGVAVIGTNLFGFVTLNLHTANNGAPTQRFAIHSDVLFAGTTIVNSGTGVVQTDPNSPFAASDFSSDGLALKQRPVSVGLRIRYSGREDARGGTVVGAISPNHGTLTAHGFSGLLQYDKSEALPVSREWQNLVWTPMHHDEMQYGSTSGSIVHHIGFMMSGAAGLTFDFEATINYEVIGQDARGKTENVSASGFTQDVVGVLQSWTAEQMSANIRSAAGSVGAAFVSGVVHMVEGHVRGAFPGASGAARIGG